MTEREESDIKQETTLPVPHGKKKLPRYTHENKKENRKQNESQTGRWSTGKKQRQQENAKNGVLFAELLEFIEDCWQYTNTHLLAFCERF